VWVKFVHNLMHELEAKFQVITGQCTIDSVHRTAKVMGVHNDNVERTLEEEDEYTKSG
jgi:hypothetical protein